MGPRTRLRDHLPALPADLLTGHRAGAGVVAAVLTGAHDRFALERAPHTHILESIAQLPGVVRAAQKPAVPEDDKTFATPI